MKRFSTQEEAGTVHVAVQSIARFDDEYTDELQPHFDLSSEDALDAISQTQVSEMERLRALLAELNIAGQKRTVTSERTIDKGEVTKETSTEKTDPPDLSTVGAKPAAKALTNTAPAVIAGNSVQLDQSLRYRAAAALIQEIALFNRYVRDAAVTRDSIPYVVRLLVTVNPSARREPYDVYTTISFFSSDKPDFQHDAAELKTYEAYRGISLDTIASQLQDAIGANACERAVEVIPLFVTDNLESSLNSSANERNIDASGGGSGFFANFAASLGLRAQAIDRDRSVGQGLNGLTTISRLGNNTILARLGASNANNQFEMVARTYNVTLLALVPTTAGLSRSTIEKRPTWSPAQFGSLQNVTPCSDLTFTAYSKFRDAVRGRDVPTAYAAQRDRAVADLVKNWNLSTTSPSTAAGHVAQLLLLAEQGEYTKFGAAANGLTSTTVDLRDAAVRNMLWHDLVRLSHISGRSYGKFQLPERIDRFFAAQEVTLFDDSKKTTVVVNGARNLSDDGLHARLELNDAAGNVVFLDDAGVSISSDRHRATFTFPSVEARLGTKTGVQAKFTASKIVSGARGVQTTTEIMPATRVTYRPIDPVTPPKPTTMAITTDTIRLATGGGEFAVAFSSDKSKPTPVVFVEIDGGTIATVTPAAPVTGNGIEVVAQGNYVIALKNLFADTPVKVRALLADGTVVGAKTLALKP
ncbi:MAG TPA: hypothetical protein VM733_16585 [Thermoanaerobaculia bacterium]|nr:hypothetical protein [Thermoanaerobaculia bacterium]